MLLRKKDWLPDGEGFRLKTARLRGQISQGLITPVPNFDGMNYLLPAGETTAHAGNMVPVRVGEDVTQLLKVVKWDPPVPACLAGLARGNFPSFIQKTDQERVQNIWAELKEKYSGLPFEVTTKLDGSSCTYYHNNGDVGVCSRNLNLKLEGNDDNTFVKYANECDLLSAMSKMGDNIAIQGEMCGRGIQGNREGLKVAEFFVFDVFCIDDGRHATPAERAFYLEKLEALTGVKLNQVPFIEEVTLDKFEKIEDILAYAEGPSLNHKVREGVVFKAVAVVNGVVPSFKAISNEFLLGEK